MKTRGMVLLPLLIMISAVVAFAAVAYAVMSIQKNGGSNTNMNQTACTLEAKVCPDGSVVGRVPPSCEFQACPALTCGAIAGLTCPEGYTCVLDDTNVSDAAGTCVLSSGINVNAANSNSNASANTSTAIPSDWKTYTNTVWGFSFQYPNAWSVADNTPKAITDQGSLINESLQLTGVTETENGMQYPRMVLYASPLGWSAGPAHVVYTLRQSEGRWNIQSKDTYHPVGDAPLLPDRYTIRFHGTEGMENGGMYATLVSSTKGTSDATFDQLVEQMITSFRFTGGE